jgi:UDP:flavonoid glycosyltransferase YjiC (YdhE family)
MKKRMYATLIISAILLSVTAFAAQSDAGVSINVGVFAPPPAYMVPAPPQVVVIPGTYVYAVPDPAVEVFFYHGYWWRPYEGRWYRSNHYNGNWVFVRNERVPHAIIEVPRDYHRHIPPGQRIAHDDMKRNWKRWERDRYWDRREERRENRWEDHRDRHGDGDRHFR